MQSPKLVNLFRSRRARFGSRSLGRGLGAVLALVVTTMAGCDLATVSVVGDEAAIDAKAASGSAPSARSSPLASAKRVSRHFVGTVHEVEQVPGYTYVAVSPLDEESTVDDGTANNALWVATLKRDLSVGDLVTVTLIAERTEFRSAHLARVFPSLFFGVVRRRPASPKVGVAVSLGRDKTVAASPSAQWR